LKEKEKHTKRYQSPETILRLSSLCVLVVVVDAFGRVEVVTDTFGRVKETVVGGWTRRDGGGDGSGDVGGGRGPTRGGRGRSLEMNKNYH
jgi:hypothetical protein